MRRIHEYLRDEIWENLAQNQDRYRRSKHYIDDDVIFETIEEKFDTLLEMLADEGFDQCPLIEENYDEIVEFLGDMITARDMDNMLDDLMEMDEDWELFRQGGYMALYGLSQKDFLS